MKKVFGLLFIFCASLILASCSTTNYEKEVEKLVREKKYNEAREIYYEHLAEEFEADKILLDISKNEIEDCYDDFDLNAIKEIKREQKRSIERIDYLCQEVFANSIGDILKRGRFDFVFSVFDDWKILYPYELECEQDEYYERDFNDGVDYHEAIVWGRFNIKEAVDPNNMKYNAEASYLNNLLDKTIAVLIEEKDIQSLQQCLSYYKPCIIIKNKKKSRSETSSFLGDKTTTVYYNYTFALDDSAKQEAIKKIAAAGLQL